MNSNDYDYTKFDTAMPTKQLNTSNDINRARLFMHQISFMLAILIWSNKVTMDRVICFTSCLLIALCTVTFSYLLPIEHFRFNTIWKFLVLTIITYRTISSPMWFRFFLMCSILNCYLVPIIKNLKSLDGYIKRPPYNISNWK